MWTRAVALHLFETSQTFMQPELCPGLRPVSFKHFLLVAKYKVIFSQEHVLIIASAVRHSDVSELFISSLPFL